MRYSVRCDHKRGHRRGAGKFYYTHSTKERESHHTTLRGGRTGSRGSTERPGSTKQVGRRGRGKGKKVNLWANAFIRSQGKVHSKK